MIPAARPRTPRYRWECHCSDPPVLLARYEPGGAVEMKCRDRWYYVTGGKVQAVCPKCGRYHDGPPDANGNGMG